ncbi:MAG: N-acetylmuramoyl-L-alanine amidase [Desulfobacterales bacterium]
MLRRLTLMIVVLWGISQTTGMPTAEAVSVKEAFFKTDNASRQLLDTPALQKYRHNWIKIIRGFDSVFRSDPEGPYAPASLFRMGVLYKELHRWSNRSSDLQEARDLFERIALRFPKSGYRSKALNELKVMGKGAPAGKASPKTATPKREDPAIRNAFETADACTRRLAGNPRREKHRDVWLNCIEQYESIAKKDPEGSYAAGSLFKAGSLYLDLFGYSRSPEDQERGRAYLSKVKTDFADSRYRPMAEARLGERSTVPVSPAPASNADPIASLIEDATGGRNNGKPSGSRAASGIGGMQRVTGLRFWSNPSYTRVVIDADEKTPYFHHLLKKDPDLKKPQRLYVDISNCRLGRDIPKLIDINDNLLIATRAGQFSSDTVRVVVDIKSFRTYKIFSLMNPFRIIIDVWGEDPGRSSPQVAARGSGAINGKLPPSALAKQLALGVSRVVVDPGHGGKDPGAPGYLKGVQEKHITLQIGKRVAQKIRERIGAEVLMTRTTDQYLTLEERTAFANTKNADLFISIHTNAHRNRDAYGTETYFLNLATDEDAIRVAAMENATSAKNISDLQTILTDLMQNAKINESSRLATYVQTSMSGKLASRYQQVKNLGVKQAPFYVLLGAQMPAVLVETAFISNPRECKRLLDPQYQDHLADAIVDGVERYIVEIQPTVHWQPPGRNNS